MTVTILHEKCEPAAAKDKKLPNTAYLVEYKIEGKSTYDIAISQKAVESVSYTHLTLPTKRIV